MTEIVVVQPEPPAEPPAPIVVVEPPAEPSPEPAPAIVIAPEPSELESRMRECENRLNLHDAQFVEHRTLIDNRAEHAHDHPLPAGVQALADHLNAMDEEDVPPTRRKSLLHRKLW